MKEAGRSILSRHFCGGGLWENSLQSSLHFLSERCSSLSRELLKVSREEMLYSFISRGLLVENVRQSLLVRRPIYSRQVRHRQSLFRTSHRNNLYAHGIWAGKRRKGHKTRKARQVVVCFIGHVGHSFLSL